MGWGQMNLTQAFGDGGIVAAVNGHVGLLTISNARRKNALNLAMWQGMSGSGRVARITRRPRHHPAGRWRRGLLSRRRHFRIR